MSIEVMRQERGNFVARLSRLGRSAIVDLPLLPIAVIVAVAFAISVPGFATAANLETMARVFAPLLVAAIGATLIMLTGGIDLSVGATFGLASVAGALVMRDTGSISLGLAAGISVGALVGFINGVAVARFRLAPFVYTLAVLLTTRAIAFLLSRGYSVGRLPREVTAFGRSDFLAIPSLLWIAIVIFVVALIVLYKTPFGRSIYLTGSNERAALFNAVDVVPVKFLVYLIGGTLSGVASMLAVMRLGSGGPVLGDTILLQIIAAVVAGGTSVFGGQGGLWRTFTGVMLIVMLEKGLDLMAVAFFDQAIVIGCVILLGSALGVILRDRRLSPSD